MKHYVDDYGRIKTLEMPTEDYPLATVVDTPTRITLEDIISFLVDCQPAALIMWRMMLICVWVYLLASLVLGKF